MTLMISASQLANDIAEPEPKRRKKINQQQESTFFFPFVSALPPDGLMPI
jgi:hypothetical protein